MQEKDFLRKKYFSLRKKKYFEIEKNFFLPLINLIKEKFYNKKINLSIYYPASFELNILKLLKIDYVKRQTILLPVIEENNLMNFFKWKENEVLFVNKYGMLEPIKSKAVIPNVIIVPLLSFDNNKYRLGYGKGFYDRYLNRYLKKFKNIITIGIAFSFQKYHKLPVNNNDVKLDYILTEKGIF
jgi:5-formyltetrahydrofolate cyclo-ligase